MKGTRDSRWMPYRVLICRPNSRLGNTLLLTPLVQELEARFPSAEVDVLTSCPAARDIFREFSCVRTIHQYPRLGVRHPINHILTLLRARRVHYDLIIDPCFKSRSARLALRILRSDLKIGFSRSHENRGTDLNIPVAESPTTHMGIYPVHLLRRTVLNGRDGVTERDVPRLSIHLTAAERRYGRQKLRQLIGDAEKSSVLAVNLMATGAKRLPLAWWHKMLAAFCACRPETRIIEILPALGVASLPDYPGFFSSDIRRVAAVIDAADCFVSADGGLMHLGTATKTTTIGLFTVTDPAVYAPYGGANRAIRVTDSSPDSVGRQISRHFISEQQCPEQSDRDVSVSEQR